MKHKILRRVVGIAILLAFAQSTADIARENWRLHQAAVEYAQRDQPYSEVFSAPRYEEISLFYVDTSVELSLFEPPHGVYLGAYILSDGVVNGDITRFEQMMGRHSIYKYHLDITGGFPDEFVFDSAVRGRAPFFVLERGEVRDDEEFMELAEELAREFGYYFSPVFVQPPKPERGEDAAAYIARFVRVRELFRRHAPHVAFVYAVDAADAEIAEDFYPGDEHVDWVGVRAMASMSPERPFEGDMLAAIDEVYFAFQERKPMFVSLGISRQSCHDFIHRPRLAAAELERVYSALLADYPRIKGIIYMNFNEISLNRGQNIRDNYLITDDDVLRSVYRELASHPSVVNAVAVTGEDLSGGGLMRSRHGALRVGGVYYVSEQALLDELRISRNRLRGRSRARNGARFYPFAPFVQSNEWVLQAHGSHITIVPTGAVTVGTGGV
ncbi:MAG: hypothetical protein FWE20_01540 [Defluviitaleaceae bacterium]|nr:hypothetical protein [Defluviitaleaceae bacterium]